MDNLGDKAGAVMGTASSSVERNNSTPQLRYFQTLGELVVAIQNAALKDWVPHPLSPEERYNLNHESSLRLEKIRALEELQSKSTSGTNSQLEKSMLVTRLDYRIRFWRTFRVNDLPAEIITNILRFVVWTSPDPQAGIRWRLWLTWTCRHWRTITLQDSTIWSAIWFRDLPPFERSLAWVDRAGTAPLDIRINDAKDRKITEAEMGRLMDSLATKITSIRMLIIIVEEWEPVLVVLDRLRSAANVSTPLIIERFELHRSGSPYVQIGDDYLPNSLRQPVPLFGGAPTPFLTYFSINGVHIDWQQSFLRNLTTLDIRRMPLERSPELSHFRAILSNSPGLRKLCLDGAGPQWHPEEPCALPPIQLSHLRVFVLADVSLHYALYILGHISAPKVRDLTVMNLVGEDYSPLFGAITSRFPEVQLLTVYSVETLQSSQTDHTLVKWLDSMPLLSYLRLANIKKTFFDAFLYSPETLMRMSLHAQTSSPPRLVCPRVSVVDFQAISPKVVADWGNARKAIGVPLKKIYITKDTSRKMSSHDHQMLRAIAELHIVEWGGTTLEEDSILRSES